MTTNLVDNASKVCATCGLDKPLAEYYRCTLRHGKGGYRQECKRCGSERNRRWREENPDKVKGYNLKHNALAKEDGRQREWHLQRTYGISTKDYESLLAAQGGGCAVCGNTQDTLHVDHDHETGDIRGLLCTQRNLAIGLLRDDPEIALSVSRYLTGIRGR